MAQFHEYTGVYFAGLLPYRKKSMLWGPPVCEWAAVLPMAKSVFLMACSLALADAEAAEDALDQASAGDWESEFAGVVESLAARAVANPAVSATYAGFFPDANPHTRSDAGSLMSPEDCASALSQRVLIGLACGLKHDAHAAAMLEAWVERRDGWQRLGVGGLSVDDAPNVSSVQQAKDMAREIYQAWSASELTF